PAGVRQAAVSEGELQAHCFSSKPHAPGVLVLGGSEGGYPDEDAALLASHGFTALSVAYFGIDGGRKELAEIPIELFQRALDWLARQAAVDSSKLAVLGTSKGAEAALLLAARNSRVKAVVAYAPSSIAWSCICSSDTLGSWTLGGAAIPFGRPAQDPTYHR